MVELKVNPDTGVPFYRQVEDQLRELIRSGKLQEGERLPSVRELSRELMVSLITVRRSYADLERDGWIIRKQGQGTFVASPPEVGHEDTKEEAKQLLREAVAQAKRLGLEGDELCDWMEALMQEENNHELD